MSRCERYTRSSYRCADVWPWSVFTLAGADSVCVYRTQSSLLHHRIVPTAGRSLLRMPLCGRWDEYSLCVTRAASVICWCTIDARTKQRTRAEHTHTHTHTREIPPRVLPYDNRFNLRDDACESLSESRRNRSLKIHKANDGHQPRGFAR